MISVASSRDMYHFLALERLEFSSATFFISASILALVLGRQLMVEIDVVIKSGVRRWPPMSRLGLGEDAQQRGRKDMQTPSGGSSSRGVITAWAGRDLKSWKD